MAKRRSKTPRSQIAPSFTFGERSVPSVGIYVPPGFNYTTPSAHPPRTAKERRAYGCEEIGKKFTGRLKDGRPDTFCKITSTPCGSKNSPRASCPVQLVWVRGKPNLRFCKEPAEPGYLVPVDNPSQAQAYARKACKDWPHKPKLRAEWPKDFFGKKASFVVDDAEKAYPRTPYGEPGLGRVKPGPEWMQGEAGAWITFLVPIGALFTYLLVVGGNKSR